MWSDCEKTLACQRKPRWEIWHTASQQRSLYMGTYFQSKLCERFNRSHYACVTVQRDRMIRTESMISCSEFHPKKPSSQKDDKESIQVVSYNIGDIPWDATGVECLIVVSDGSKKDSQLTFGAVSGRKRIKEITRIILSHPQGVSSYRAELGRLLKSCKVVRQMESKGAR